MRGRCCHCGKFWLDVADFLFGADGSTGASLCVTGV
jgi:hypothetical protein